MNTGESDNTAKDRTPNVSVIIPTYNRKNSLTATLDSLADLDYPKDRYEVVVVGDGSRDGTEDTIRGIKGRLPYSLSYHAQEKKGISAAKNLGIREAGGDLLVFTDDDCIFEKDWLSRLIGHLDSPDVGAVGGPDRSPSDASFFARSVDYTVTSFAGTGGVRRKEGVRLAKYYPRGCNIAFPQAVIEKAGGYDETLAAGEEIELDYRIRQAGYLLKYAPDAPVWHKRRGSLLGFLRQMYSRGYTRVELARRHLALLEPSYLLPPLAIVGFMVLGGGAFLFPFLLKIMISLSSLYLGIILVAGAHGSLKIKDPRAWPIVSALLIMQHLTYGLGFLKALFCRRKL